MNQSQLRDLRREMVGQVLQDLRAEHDLSRQGMANLLGFTEVALSKWERGIYLPSQDAQVAILAQLGRAAGRRLIDAVANYRERIARHERSTALQQLRA